MQKKSLGQNTNSHNALECPWWTLGLFFLLSARQQKLSNGTCVLHQQLLNDKLAQKIPKQQLMFLVTPLFPHPLVLA